MQLTGGQMIVEYLISEGVEYVFAIPGHGNTALIDAFVDYQDRITVLPAMHEQGAAHMADGFYRSSGRIAAAITSIGPASTNALTGLATAYADSIPLLLITGGVHTYMENRGVLQEIDRPHSNNFPAMAAPVVKRWWQPSRLEQFPTVLHQAFNTMLDGRRGPVLLDIAQDLQAELGEWDPPEPQRRRAAGRPSGSRPDLARAAANPGIGQATRPPWRWWRRPGRRGRDVRTHRGAPGRPRHDDVQREGRDSGGPRSVRLALRRHRIDLRKRDDAERRCDSRRRLPLQRSRDLVIPTRCYVQHRHDHQARTD